MNQNSFPFKRMGAGLLVILVAYVLGKTGHPWYAALAYLGGVGLVVVVPGWWLWRGRHRVMSSFIGVGLCAAAYGLGYLSTGWSIVAWLVGVPVAATPTVLYFVRGRHGAGALIKRRSTKTKKHGGVASKLDRRGGSSRRAMRTQWARSLRPSYGRLADVCVPDAPSWMPGNKHINRMIVRPIEAQLTELFIWWKLLFISAHEYAARLGSDNHGGYWVPQNSVIVRLAMARSGKSTAMAVRIIDHTGPVIVTSTRKDLWEMTSVVRESAGPVHIFNAGDVGGLASTLKWSVLSGCKSIGVAKLRANDLLGEVTGEGERWAAQAAEMLSGLMYAAAWADGSMRLVARWVNDTGDRAAKNWAKIQAVVAGTPAGQEVITGLSNFFGMVGENEKTRMSITFSAQPALAWLSDPRTAALGDCPIFDVDQPLFDVKRDLIDANATIYLLGAKDRGAGALTGALTAEIVRQTSMYAERMPKGRLDPPMLMALDELTLTCPGPVPDWVKDMGGRGICFDLGEQNRGSVDKRWGVNGRQALFGNATVLLGRGCNDANEAREWASLSGTRLDVRETTNAKGEVMSRTPTPVPVVDPGTIMSVKVGRCLVFSPGQPVTEIRTPNGERDRRIVKGMKELARRGVTLATSYEDEMADDEVRELAS
jgi:type IV secretion system protein VirD4